MIDSYQTYVDWCRDHNRPAPTREEWQAWCSQPRRLAIRSRDDLELEREAREGWGGSR